MKGDPTCAACKGQSMMGRAVVHATDKIQKSMGEFKSGTLHSGSKTGPVVTNPKQAIAIGLSEQRKKARGGY